jgi:hypothetical protein
MPPDEAWKKAFPDLTPDDLYVALLDWLGHGGYAVSHYEIEIERWDVRRALVSDADVYAMRAMLAFVTKQGDAGRDVVAAVTLDRSNVLARAVQLRLDYRPLDVDAARAVANAHPQSWIAWDMLRRALGSVPEARVVERIACSLVVVNPSLVVPSYCRRTSPSLIRRFLEVVLGTRDLERADQAVPTPTDRK